MSLMENHSTMSQAALNGLLDEMNKRKSELEKSVTGMIGKFEAITKKFNFVKEKKTKLNKMPATMMMNADKSILIVFDSPDDSEKFYGK